MSINNNDITLTGSQIKEIRKMHGLSQQEFGARLGVSHAHISKIESGKEKPSETLLRLIRYEFRIDRILGIPPADVTMPQIKQYLNILNDMLTEDKMSDECLYNSEYILASFVTILKETEESDMLRVLLFEALGGILDEVAMFLERSTDGLLDAHYKTLATSKFKRTTTEIMACCNVLLDLLSSEA